MLGKRRLNSFVFSQPLQVIHAQDLDQRDFLRSNKKFDPNPIIKTSNARVREIWLIGTKPNFQKQTICEKFKLWKFILNFWCSLRIQSPLAKLYSTSVMEHHHFNQCIMILHNNVRKHNAWFLRYDQLYPLILFQIQGQQYSHKFVIKRIFHCHGDYWKMHTGNWSLIALIVSVSISITQLLLTYWCPSTKTLDKKKGKLPVLLISQTVQIIIDSTQRKIKNYWCMCSFIIFRVNRWRLFC